MNITENSTENEIVEYIKQKLTDYAKLKDLIEFIKDNEIDGNLFLNLTDEKLREWGMTAGARRERLLNIIPKTEELSEELKELKFIFPNYPNKNVIYFITFEEYENDENDNDIIVYNPYQGDNPVCDVYEFERHGDDMEISHDDIMDSECLTIYKYQLISFILLKLNQYKTVHIYKEDNLIYCLNINDKMELFLKFFTWANLLQSS